jgi:ribosome maturation protein SDO1
MGVGRSPTIVSKEKISFNLARLKKGGEVFEVVLEDPDKAVALRSGLSVDIKDILKSEHIYKDAYKGELANEESVKKWLKTTDPLVAADKIIREGEIQFTGEYRRQLSERKKKQIIDFIHTNAIDPKTNLPHPPKRIELAMDEAGVKIDLFTPVEVQIDNIVQKLRPVLPLSLEKLHLKIHLPARYVGHAYSVLKGKYKLLKENWLNDGSVNFELEAPAGLRSDIINLIHKLCNGEADIEG